MLGFDRVKESVFGVVRAAIPRVDYMCAYRGTVVSQTGQTVDLKMDDARLPGMSGVPLQVGIPGATVEVASGARVLVAFENGDPAKPVAMPWDQGAHAIRVSFPAELLELGAEGVADYIVKGTTYRAAEHALNAGSLGLAKAFELLSAAAVGPLAPLKPGFLQAQRAIEAFEAQAGAFLSRTVRTI